MAKLCDWLMKWPARGLGCPKGQMGTGWLMGSSCSAGGIKELTDSWARE